MDVSSLKAAMKSISKLMNKNRDYLTRLDQQNGDGDLGISMSCGYQAVSQFLNETEETDMGAVMMKAALVFNDAAPSSLGTITSVAMMGMSQSLKGHTDVNLHEIAMAMKNGIDMIVEVAGSKPGEKTILDALCPGVQALLDNCACEDMAVAFQAASRAAQIGSERTREMRAVHGRAVYYGDKSIGILDGGSVVGSLIFEALSICCSK